MIVLVVTGGDAESTVVIPHTGFFSETLAGEAQPRLQLLGSRTVMKQGLSVYLGVMAAVTSSLHRLPGSIKSI
jgi:hypothetical protein